MKEMVDLWSAGGHGLRGKVRAGACCWRGF